MTAATTIAPALNPLRTVPPRRVDSPTAEPAPIEHNPVVEPQHMQALAKANEVRLARAALKRQVASGQRSAIEVIRDCPWETRSMTIGELLASQRRWGRARARKLVVPLRMSENKELGTLTERQRGILAKALEDKAAC